MLLQQHLELAIRAHNGTSFSPERRGAQYVKDYSEELEADLAKVSEKGGDLTEYRQKYESLFVSWMSAKSRCLSSMITGPSGFPVRRAQKANQSEQNRYQEFTGFREKYFARLERDARREARAASDPLAEMRANVAQAEKYQEIMKTANAICRNKKTTEEEKRAALLAAGFSKQQHDALLIPAYSYEKPGFQTWQLTNNNANIRRMQERVAELEKKIQASTKETERQDGVRIVENAEADRLQIFFPEKPSPEMIAELKGRGFKWAPSVPCWQRQLTDNARYAVKQILK